MFDQEYKSTQAPVLGPKAQAAFREFLETPFSEIIPEALKDADLPSDISMGEFGDMSRGMMQRCPVGDYVRYLGRLDGWTPTHVTDRETARGGDYLFCLDVSGESVPAFYFPAHTVPFDTTDPLLESMIEHMSETLDTYLLMMPMPSFKFRHTASGAITQVIVHGGWFVRHGQRSPFVLSSRGSVSLADQARFFRSSQLSSGFYRDHSLAPEHVGDMLNLQLALCQSTVVPEGLEKLWPKVSSKDELGMATGSENWCSFASRALKGILDSFQSAFGA